MLTLFYGALSSFFFFPFFFFLVTTVWMSQFCDDAPISGARIGVISLQKVTAPMGGLLGYPPPHVSSLPQLHCQSLSVPISLMSLPQVLSAIHLKGKNIWVFLVLAVVHYESKGGLDHISLADPWDSHMINLIYVHFQVFVYSGVPYFLQLMPMRLSTDVPI